MSTLAVYREPFSFQPKVRHFSERLSLAEIAAKMPLPDEFEARGKVCVNGEVAPRALWGSIRPKPDAPVEVTFHLPLQGGGGGDDKNPLAVVASIALFALTGFIGGGANGLLGSAFAQGSVGANLLAGGVGLAGALLVSSLTPPPSFDLADPRPETRQQGTASAEGNVLSPNGAIPRVLGTHKIFPPQAVEPFVYFDGEDEVVEAIYCLAGPHNVADIRVQDAPIDNIAGLDFEVREGFPGDAPLSLIERQTRTAQLRAEMRGHDVEDSDGRTLDTANQSVIDTLPQPQTVLARREVDEIRLDLTFPQGLHRNASESDRLRVPFRLRVRPLGDEDWINLPELHYQAASLRPRRATIRLIFEDAPSATPQAANLEGWIEARRSCTGQSLAPASAQYFADGSFDNGSGGAVRLTAGTVGTTSVQNVELERYEARIFLDRAVFDADQYEVEIVRGFTFRNSEYTSSNYQVASSVRDFFGYQGTVTPLIYQSRDGVSDAVYLLRVASLWNEAPIAADGLALIAVRARNVQVQGVSTVASGYVPDWDGSAWTDWKITDNPAPHYRDTLRGMLNFDRVPASAVDDAGLVEWRDACAASGYRCNAIIEDKSAADVMRLLASSGYAQPFMSEIWGVARDYDRTGEAPVQIFSPRNAANVRWSKAFPRLPDGFRVSFRDAAQNYDTRQITVLRDGLTGQSDRLEQITYDGITDEAEAIARSRFDLRTGELRGVFHFFDAPAEAIVCRKGSLIGLTHDMLTDVGGQGRITEVSVDGAGDVTALRLDDEVEVVSEPFIDQVANLVAVDNIARLGVRSGAVIRRNNGTITTHTISNVTGRSDQLNFVPSISPDGIIGPGDEVEDVLVLAGPLGRETRRLVVASIEPREDLTATITAVDEATELWAA